MILTPFAFAKPGDFGTHNDALAAMDRDDAFRKVDAILSVLSDPTDAMLKAGDDVILTDEQFHSGPFSTLKAEWRAMVAAIGRGA
jgi:hypothetical protein